MTPKSLIEQLMKSCGASTAPTPSPSDSHNEMLKAMRDAHECIDAEKDPKRKLEMRNELLDTQIKIARRALEGLPAELTSMFKLMSLTQYAICCVDLENSGGDLNVLKRKLFD